MQAAHERLLQRLDLLGAQRPPAGFQRRTGRGCAGAREDRARNRDAQTLTDDPPGGQYAGGDTLAHEAARLP